jgi:hypothetical protein
MNMSLESFIYVSDEIGKIKGFSISYGSKLEQYQIYRLINQKIERKPPYYIEKSTIYYLEDEENLDFLSNLKDLKAYGLTLVGNPQKVSLDLGDTNQDIIARALLKESLLLFLRGKKQEFRRFHGKLINTIDVDRENNFKRDIVLAFDYKIIDSSVLLVIDLRHEHELFDKTKFKEYSLLTPDKRYTIIKQYLASVFGNLDEIEFPVPGNDSIQLSRIKSN